MSGYGGRNLNTAVPVSFRWRGWIRSRNRRRSLFNGMHDHTAGDFPADDLLSSQVSRCRKPDSAHHSGGSDGRPVTLPIGAATATVRERQLAASESISVAVS